MKTLSEIIEICKSGGKPDVDDARFAICALSALLTFESTTLMRRFSRDEEGKKDVFGHKHYFEESFNRIKRALDIPPIKWLGSGQNPDDPEVQKRRKISRKLWDKVVNEESNDETL